MDSIDYYYRKYYKLNILKRDLNDLKKAQGPKQDNVHKKQVAKKKKASKLSAFSPPTTRNKKNKTK